MIAPDQSAFRETYRGHVENWEIDQNLHWNAKFFVRSFERSLDWLLALEPSGFHRLVHRHIGFHRELFNETPVEAGSAVLADDPTMVVHALWNGETGELCATGTDRVSEPMTILPAIDREMAKSFIPRSLTLDPVQPQDTTAVLAAGKGMVVWRGLIRPYHADHLGQLLPYAFNGFVSEGQGHVWKHQGIPIPILTRNNIGRVLVEMTMTPHQPARAGEAVEMVAWFERLGGKLFGIRYQLNRSRDGAALATLDTIGLFIDRGTRRSIALPQEIIELSR